MSGTVSKSLGLSSSPPDEKKQGIVSILGSDCHQTSAAASLRRTLSADMSSKKWLAEHGFTPMKKTSSSQKLTIPPLSDSSESEEERPGQDEVWRSIQSQKKNDDLNSWSSILTEKATQDSSNLSPPYVHPLVKRRASSLSENSLKICTESLGSETGSDGFSSHPPSENGETEEDKEESLLPQPGKEYTWFDAEEVRVVESNNNFSVSKKLGPRSFPPPLPSLTQRDGPSLHMQSHRNNGRLVLEAVSVPSHNCFRAHRQDGRLVLTFAEQPIHQEVESVDLVQEEDQVSDMDEDVVLNSFGQETDCDTEEETETEEDKEEEQAEVEESIEDKNNAAKEIGVVREQPINVHRSALVMKRLMGLGNRNPTWTNKFNKGAKFMDEVEEPNPLPQSLPRPPRVARLIPSPPPTTAAAAAAATSLNAYECFWRTKPTVATLCPPLNKTNHNKGILAKPNQQQQEMVLLRGNKADYLVPVTRSCKEPRRSLLIWEPYCIASS